MQLIFSAALIFCCFCSILSLDPVKTSSVAPVNATQQIANATVEVLPKDEDKIKIKSPRTAITPWGPMNDTDADSDSGFFAFFRKLFRGFGKKHHKDSDDESSGDSKNCNKWGCSAGGAQKCGMFGCSGRTL